jgi:small multidrug resistance family-3 protein
LAIIYKGILNSLFLFFLAGLCEIGGGYLIWLWIREDYGWVFGVFGGLVLFLYGVVPAFQKSYFHRIYAAYGGIFIVMALSWGFFFEGVIPDTFDILGTIVASIGVIIIFYFPRKTGGDEIGISSSV